MSTLKTLIPAYAYRSSSRVIRNDRARLVARIRYKKIHGIPIAYLSIEPMAGEYNTELLRILCDFANTIPYNVSLSKAALFGFACECLIPDPDLFMVIWEIYAPHVGVVLSGNRFKRTIAAVFEDPER